MKLCCPWSSLLDTSSNTLCLCLKQLLSELLCLVYCWVWIFKLLHQTVCLIEIFTPYHWNTIGMYLYGTLEPDWNLSFSIHFLGYIFLDVSLASGVVQVPLVTGRGFKPNGKSPYNADLQLLTSLSPWLRWSDLSGQASKEKGHIHSQHN